MVEKNQQYSNFAISRDGEFPPEARLTIALVLVARRWRSVLDEKLRAIHQGTARMEALSAIHNSPEATSQVNIARRLRIEGPTLTRMIDSLEKDGLVERLSDPEDRRTKKLKVTPAGEAALKDIFAIADTYRERLLVDLSAEEVDMMNDLLIGMLDKLDDGLPEPEA
jgi:MarR family transcriptional regulator for hemolysin